MTEAFDGLFDGRRVLLTGHTGFKGSWLALWLADLGAEVHGYALEPPTSPSLFEQAGVAMRLASDTRADVRDAGALARAFRAAQPEFVFHLAAQSLVRRSYAEPAETFDVNLMGTVRVLDAVRESQGVRVCQVITTDKCYENREWEYGYRETDPVGGRDPYSASKACAELATAAYRRSFLDGTPVSLASVRAGNVIGGGDWAEDRIVPDCVRAWRAGAAVTVRNPRAVRPWQHVAEPMGGYLALAAAQWREPAAFADTWNFGPEPAATVTVGEVVSGLAARWPGDARAEMLAPDPAQPHEAGTLRLDTSRARARLGWAPVLSLDEALDLTVAGYQDGDAGEVCRAQLRDYTARAALRGAAWAGGAR